MPELDAIMKLEVPIVVRLGAKAMSMQDVLGLAPGSIIELPKGSDEELDLLVNNKHLGFGSAVKVSENFGIQVSYIGDLAERVESLTAPDTEESDDDDAASLAAALLAGQ